jgi:hypothetical protein
MNPSHTKKCQDYKRLNKKICIFANLKNLKKTELCMQL